MSSFDLVRTSSFARDFQSDITKLKAFLKTATLLDMEMLKYEAKKFAEPDVRAAVLDEEQNRRDANQLF